MIDSGSFGNASTLYDVQIPSSERRNDWSVTPQVIQFSRTTSDVMFIVTFADWTHLLTVSL